MLYADEIQLGKTKVVLRPEYGTMAKNFWLYQNKWREQDEAKGDSLVIGGEYTVWKIVDRAVYLQDKYKRYELPDTVGIHDLALVGERVECGFRMGDMVRPNDSFDFGSFKSELQSYYNFYFSKSHAAPHKVTGVINNYFMFFDVTPYSGYSLPFYCDDFVKN